MFSKEVLLAKLYHARKSATVYYGAALMAMPDALQYAHDNFADLQNYIPHSLQSPVFHIIGFGVLVCRFRTLGQQK
jgi:hypothetical protein